MLLFRFFKICSSMENFHIEVEHLRSILKCNNYPVNIIDQCIKKFLDKLYVPKQIVLTVPKRELLVVLPFLGTFSLNLRKRLYKSVSKSLPQCNIKVIFQSNNWLSSFFKFRYSISLDLHSHLIYKFQCSNCNITYYGETERHLKVRAGEHISTSPLTGKRVHNNKKSSVKDHCLLSGHVCSFDDFTVLNYESHKFKRLIKESLLVAKDKQLLNKQVTSLKLANSFYSIPLTCFPVNFAKFLRIPFLTEHLRWLLLENTLLYKLNHRPFNGMWLSFLQCFFLAYVVLYIIIIISSNYPSEILENPYCFYGIIFFLL